MHVMGWIIIAWAHYKTSAARLVLLLWVILYCEKRGINYSTELIANRYFCNCYNYNYFENIYCHVHMTINECHVPHSCGRALWNWSEYHGLPKTFMITDDLFPSQHMFILIVMPCFQFIYLNVDSACIYTCHVVRISTSEM